MRVKYTVQVFNDAHAFCQSETKRAAREFFEKARQQYPNDAIVFRGPTGRIAEQAASQQAQPPQNLLTDKDQSAQ